VHEAGFSGLRAAFFPPHAEMQGYPERVFDDASIFVTLSGSDGKDAKPYQVKEVLNALKRAKETK